MAGGAHSGIISAGQSNKLSALTPTELGNLDGIVDASQTGFTVGTEAANAITVAVQLNDANGDAIASKKGVSFYLASDSAGDVADTTGAQTSITPGTDGMVTSPDKISGLAVSEADGDIDIKVTDTGTPTFYLVVLDGQGNRGVSGAITFA